MHTRPPVFPLLAVRLALTLALVPQAVAQKQETIHHDLRVRLYPERHHIEVVDRLGIPVDLRQPDSGLRFRLHRGLTLGEIGPGFIVEPVSDATDSARVGINDAGQDGPPVREYRLRPSDGTWPADASPSIAYSGQIHHPLIAEEQEYARSFSRTPGIIDARGAVLSGSSYWLPGFGDHLISFNLAVEVPESWDAVSQGRRTEAVVQDGRRRVVWECPEPMDEVHLIAAAFTEYSRPAGKVTAYAFLRQPDPNLAAKYLEATVQYLEMYRQLIGPYPYGKFALIENFWETGYGMPSFTLLGSQIIRFPFILHSSYPHEILHNWWGNSVFVDYGSGNWCEGLTAYLADHLIKEGQGQGAAYRRDTLKRYRDYVRSGQDFPLTKFRARHSSATEAVGYGKALMLFHMLRKRLGDEPFTRGLQAFYRQFTFQRASFADLESVFSEVAKTDLAPWFAQWVERTGAPELRLGRVFDNPEPGGHRVRFTLRQIQEADPYRLEVPVSISMIGEDEPHRAVVFLTRREERFELPIPAQPYAVQVDPAFDMFRRLDRAEIPPSLGQLFGAPRVLLVLPGDGAPLAAAWQTFARTWTGSEQAEVEITTADKLDELPKDRAVWVLGSDNRWATAVREATEGFGARVTGDEVAFGTQTVPRADHCFALAAVHPADQELAIGWIGADNAAALPGLARKLPHYGKYSYLAFAGSEPQNDAKGQWAATDSPLQWTMMPGRTKPIPIAAEPLARLRPVFDPQRMMNDVRWLADDERQGRGVGTPELDQVATYIQEQFAAAGLKPGGDDGTFFQTFYESGGPDGAPARLVNVVGVLPGTKTDWQRQSVVLGAHYDHLGHGWPDARAGMKGQIHNGADDNASGIAVLLEVARLLGASLEPKRSVVFVAFSGEEWGLKGSRQYVRSMRRYPITDTFAMVNLDTVGRLDGAKLSVLGTGSADEWKHIAMGIGFTTGVESNAIAGDPGGSDQRSFLEAGVPAVQLFSGGHEDYHRPSDDVEKIDADGMVKVATFAREAIVYLSDREQPLTSKLTPNSKGNAEAQPTAARRASLGTMPDFAFAGPGVRVAKVMDDSAAAKVGIMDGDVLIAIDGQEIGDLRAYSDLLKNRAPGDTVKIAVRRGEKVMDFEAKLGAR